MDILYFFSRLDKFIWTKGNTNKIIAEFKDEQGKKKKVNRKMFSIMNNTRFLVGVAYTQNELHAPEFDVRTMREQDSAFPSSTFTCWAK